MNQIISSLNCALTSARAWQRGGRHLSILKEECSTHESTFDAMISSKVRAIVELKDSKCLI